MSEWYHKLWLIRLAS